ncbi:MAG: hypothetical protein KGJ35_02290 [Patescibacteria group bacterium]|nr:hypothetical protein [Patescibacteria group bacterium]
MTEVLVNNFEYIMKVCERIILALCVMAIGAAVMYGYWIEKTIANTVALHRAQITLAAESRTMSVLSEQYVALNQNVTMGAALAQGFTPATVSSFITIPTQSSPINTDNKILTVNTF